MPAPTWTTEEQEVFLTKEGLKLKFVKNGDTTLKSFYTRTANTFLTKWPVTVTEKILEEAGGDVDKARELAEAQIHSSISWWYINRRRKKKVNPGLPTPLLDLTGKNTRKKPPLQKWQAFSAVYYRPKDSPLRAEVQALFKQRHDIDAVGFLTEFLPPTSDISSADYLTFLGAFARERCTRLSADEEGQVLAYIEEQEVLAAEHRDHPWFLDDDYDDEPLLAENRYIQQRIDELPRVAQRALEEIEKATGFKAFLVLGGLTPAENGEISTHIHTSGTAIGTGLTFTESWSETAALSNTFGRWLQLAYTEEEKQRRRGYSATTLAPPSEPTSTAPNPPNPMVVDGPSPTTPKAPSPTTPNDPSPMTPDNPSPATPDNPSPAIPDNPSPAIPDHPSPTTPDNPSRAIPDHPSPTTPDNPSPMTPEDPSPTMPEDPPPMTTNDSPQTTPIDPAPALPNDSPPLATSHSTPDTLSPLLATGVSHSFHHHHSYPIFITASIIDQLNSVDGGSRWVEMVRNYLRLESQYPLRRVGKLSLQQRPKEVASWGRQRLFMPSITDVQQFHRNWVSWWASCQPKWRSTDTWPYPQGNSRDKDWSRLNVTGPHGLFAVVVSTSWCIATTDTDSRRTFDAIVEDLLWVIENLNHVNSQVQATRSGINETIEPQLPPNSTRDPGKRQVKPTLKVRENAS